MSKTPLARRALPALALLAAIAAAPAAAQDAPVLDEAPRPGLRSTYVVPSGPGEAVRVTIYARRPAQRGRLARRYKGLRANRTVAAPTHVAPAVPVARVVRSARAAYVQRYGSYFQVLPRR